MLLWLGMAAGACTAHRPFAIAPAGVGGGSGGGGDSGKDAGSASADARDAILDTGLDASVDSGGTADGASPGQTSSDAAGERPSDTASAETAGSDAGGGGAAGTDASDAASTDARDATSSDANVQVPAPPMVIHPWIGGYTGASAVGKRPTFRWSASAGATSYDFRIGTTLALTGLTTNQYHPTSDLRGRQDWSVRACNSAGCSAFSAGWTITGVQPQDLNGDGFADILVRANSGIYLFQGGAAMDSKSDGFIPTPSSSITNGSVFFGASIAIVDEHDLLVSSRGEGRAYHYAVSGFNGLPSSGFFLSGDVGQFGYDVAGLGDIDGDGTVDLAVGNPRSGFTSAVIGNNSADVWSLDQVDTAPPPHYRLGGGIQTDGIGVAVRGAGDVNGDGYPDVLVGADGQKDFAPEMHVHLGGTTIAMHSTPAFIFTDTSFFDGFGNEVAATGDLNGDGFCDVMSGKSGMSYVYFGGPNMDQIADLILPDGSSGISSGYDVNGDGYPDVLLRGSPNVFLYFGGPQMDNRADVVFAPVAAGEGFGAALSIVGDLNGDGFADIAIGAPSAGTGGKIYIFFGGTTIHTFPDLQIPGSIAGDQLGTGFARAAPLVGP